MLLRVMLLSVAALVFLGNSAQAKNDSWSCLPNGIKPTDVVSTQVVRSAQGGREIQKTTVAQKLKDIKARCTKEKLVDASGTEIRFFRLTDCSGIPSEDTPAVIERRRQEYAELKRCYRVIEMTCNSTGEQIPASRPDPGDSGPESVAILK